MTQLDLNKQLRIGVFVALSLLLLLFTIVSLSGNSSLFTRRSHFFIEFEQAQGLGVGSVISLGGIPIGNVSDLNFADNRSAIVVRASVQKKYFSRLTTTSVFDVRTQGALGDKYIYITTDLKGEPLQEGALVISTPTPDILDLISSKTQQVGGSALELITELNILLKELNSQQRVARLAENLAQAAQNLNQLTSDKNLKETLAIANKIMKKIDNGDGTLGALINDSSLHDQILQFMGRSPRTQYLKPLLRESIRQSER